MVQIKNVPYPIRSFKVPSRSNHGIYHLVELYSDGKLYCDCLASMYKNKCYHIKLIEKHLCR